MSSSSHSSGPHSPSQAYFTMPDINTGNPSSTGNWMVATVIDDNDLMFGGKSLSTWYEEDRSQHGSGGNNNNNNNNNLKIEHEQRRGRSRERNRSHHHHHHHKHHHHGHNGGNKP